MKKQIEYLSLFEAGYTVTHIAAMYGVNKSTVSRTLTRARGKKCPFSKNCFTCPLEDCAISDKFAFMLNGNDKKRNQHYKSEEEEGYMEIINDPLDAVTGGAAERGAN